MTTQRTLGAVLFDDFELLDLYGPLEMFGTVGPELSLLTIAGRAGPVRSVQGPSGIADADFDSAPALDLILVPGGIGSLEQASNSNMLAFLRSRADTAECIMSVCSGSGILAHAGLLDGREATSNKLFFSAITAGCDSVRWCKHARWVEDGKLFTSSGVSAGIDMSLGVIAKLYGTARAYEIARMTEYEWQSDPDRDPFVEYVNQGDMASYLKVLGKA